MEMCVRNYGKSRLQNDQHTVVVPSPWYKSKLAGDATLVNFGMGVDP